MKNSPEVKSVDFDNLGMMSKKGEMLLDFKQTLLKEIKQDF